MIVRKRVKRSCAVDRGRLVQFRWNPLQRSEIDDHREAGPAPDGHRHDDIQRLRRRGQEPLRREADSVEGRVDQTVVTVGQPQKDDALRDGRDRHGDVGRGPVNRDESQRTVHRRGHQQADQHRAGHEQRGVDDRVLDRIDENGVVGQLPVVRQADPGRLGREQVRLLERQLQRHEHRQQTEDADQHHPGTHQRPAGHRLRAAEASEEGWRCPHGDVVRHVLDVS